MSTYTATRHLQDMNPKTAASSLAVRDFSGARLIKGGLLFLGVLVIGYLYAINQNAVQGFSVRGAERAVIAAKDENQKLRIEEAQMRSLSRVMESKDRLGLVESTPEKTSTDFISTGQSFALR